MRKRLRLPAFTSNQTDNNVSTFPISISICYWISMYTLWNNTFSLWHLSFLSSHALYSTSRSLFIYRLFRSMQCIGCLAWICPRDKTFNTIPFLVLFRNAWHLQYSLGILKFDSTNNINNMQNQKQNHNPENGFSFFFLLSLLLFRLKMTIAVIKIHRFLLHLFIYFLVNRLIAGAHWILAQSYHVNML